MSKLLQQQYDEVLRENVDLIAQSERLLTKLAEVEKTLITLSLHAGGRKQRDIGYETVENICDKALQQLRS